MKNWQELIFVVVGLSILGFIFSVNAQPRFVDVSALLEKNDQVLPTESITVIFSSSVDQSIEDSIRINPKMETRLSWDTDQRSLKITPQNNWQTGEKYSIQIIDGRSGKNGIVNAALTFSTLSFPKLVSFTPEDGAREVMVDIEDPLVARFDISIENFFTKVIITPSEDITYQRSEDQKSISLLAANQFKEGERYVVDLYLKHKDENDDRFKKIVETSFNTKSPAPKGVSDAMIDRLNEAKKATSSQIDQGKYVDINVTNQVMTIFENGLALDTYLISSGKRGMDTPEGSFAIYNKFPRAWSKQYGLFMPFWMAIVPSGKIGIHELPEWPSGYKEGQNHLGTPVSHGCIRLGVGAAERVYNWTEIGTPVIVHK